MIELGKVTGDKAPLISESDGKQIEELLPAEAMLVTLKGAIQKLERSIEAHGKGVIITEAISGAQALLGVDKGKDFSTVQALEKYDALAIMDETLDDPEIEWLRRSSILKDSVRYRAIAFATKNLGSGTDEGAAWALETYRVLSQIPEWKNDGQIATLKDNVFTSDVVTKTAIFAEKVLGDTSIFDLKLALRSYCMLSYMPQFQDSPRVRQFKRTVLTDGSMDAAIKSIQARMNIASAQSQKSLPIEAYRIFTSLAQAIQDDMEHVRNEHTPSLPTPPDTLIV